MIKPVSEPLFHAGDVVRKWRMAGGLTNGDLADLAGVDKNTITRIENGDSVTTEKLGDVVLALGHTVAELYRALGVPDHLAGEEFTLLAAYRRLSPEHRELVRVLAERLPPFVTRE